MENYLNVWDFNDEMIVTFYIEIEKVFAIGEKINGICNEAYMNGYNWESFINYYLAKKRPELLEGLGTDSEACTYTAIYKKSENGEQKANKLAELITYLIENEDELYNIIREESTNIEWD